MRNFLAVLNLVAGITNIIVGFQASSPLNILLGIACLASFVWVMTND